MGHVPKKAVATNGKNWPQHLQLKALNELSNSPEDEDNFNGDDTKVTLLDLFKTPNLRKNTLIQYFNWFTVVLVYYGLTLNADTLIPGNVYINFSVSGLIEIPSNIFCLVILHFFGRRFVDILEKCQLFVYIFFAQVAFSIDVLLSLIHI